MSHTKERYAGLDVARALSIFGMTFIHMVVVLSGQQVSQSPYGVYFDWFAGRPASVFMVLAGIGVSLAAMRNQQSTPRSTSDIHQRFYRRGVFFLLVGFINLVLWPGDILRVYGIAYLVAAFVLFNSNRCLWLLAILVSFTFEMMVVFLDFEVNWNFKTLEYANLWTVEGSIRNLFFNGFRAVFPWLSLFFFGMIIGRINFASRVHCWRWLLVGAGLFLAIESFSYLIIKNLLPIVEVSEQEDFIALFGTQSLPALPLFILSSAGTAVTLIMICLLVSQRTAKFLFYPLQAVGRMAFTWYIFHIIIILCISDVLNTSNGVPFLHSLLLWLGLCITMMIVSSIYSYLKARGPLEWVLRRIN